MSGEKKTYVSVEARELARMKEADSRLRSVQNDLPERLNRVKEETRREFQQRLAPLEQRAQRQEQESKQLRSNIASLEQDTQRRMQQQRQEFKQSIEAAEYRQKEAMAKETSRLESAMKSGFQQQRDEYLRITTEQRQEYTALNQQLDRKFTNLVQEEREARAQGQKILQQQIDRVFSDMKEEKEYKAAIAKDLVADIEKIWAGIDREYQHERFAPGQLDNLKRNLEMARSNLNGGLSEAAIATSQDVWIQLADLRIELERKQWEWELYRNTASEDLRTLITEAKSSQELERETKYETETVRFNLKVDYWAQGDLVKYEQRLGELEQQLKDGERTLSTEQLKEIIAQIDTLRPELGEIVDRAHDALIDSQIRAEIADRTVEVLEGMGYSLVGEDDCTYENSDNRKAYVVKVKNLAGDEVVTVIAPEQGKGASTLSVNTFSEKGVDEKFVRQQAEAILAALSEDKINKSGQMECNEQAQNQYRNIDKVRQQAVATPQPKPQAQANADPW